MTDITNHLQTITKNIEVAASNANRDPHTVHLLAVSKTRPPEDILEAAKAGQLAFGENYEQEAVSKIRLFASPVRISGWNGILSDRSRATKHVRLPNISTGFIQWTGKKSHDASPNSGRKILHH